LPNQERHKRAPLDHGARFLFVRQRFDRRTVLDRGRPRWRFNLGTGLPAIKGNQLAKIFYATAGNRN
jgi:hypothetical protein